jgi:hypothetical protein
MVVVVVVGVGVGVVVVVEVGVGVGVVVVVVVEVEVGVVVEVVVGVGVEVEVEVEVGVGMNEKPNRSPLTAHDGRPICRTCGKGYTPFRTIIRLEVYRPGPDQCQSCRQRERHARDKKVRGY